jgi:nitrogen fixation/metabolism regulation signal transduction histidine kinase
MARAIRGTAVKLTYPYALRYLGLWLMVTILAILVFSVTSYLLLADRLTGAALHHLALLLFIETVVVIAALIALALFTTHRLAGPFIALRRAFEDVQAGDLSRRLRLRRTDGPLLEVETAFNEMMASLEARGKGGVK